MGKNVPNLDPTLQIGVAAVHHHAHGSDPLRREISTPTTGRQVLTAAQVVSMKTAATTATTWTAWVAAELGTLPATESDDLRSAVLAAVAFPATTAGCTLTLRHHHGVQAIDDAAPIAHADWSGCATAAATGGSTWTSWLGTHAAALVHLTAVLRGRLGDAVGALVAF